MIWKREAESRLLSDEDNEEIPTAELKIIFGTTSGRLGHVEEHPCLSDLHRVFPILSDHIWTHVVVVSNRRPKQLCVNS